MACLYALLCEASSDSFAIYNTKYHKQKRTNCSRKSWDFTLGIYTVLCHRWRIMIRIQVIVLKKKQEAYKLKRFLRKELRGKKDSFGVLWEGTGTLDPGCLSPGCQCDWMAAALSFVRKKWENKERWNEKYFHNHRSLKPLRQGHFTEWISSCYLVQVLGKIHHRQPTRITLVFFSYHWIMGIAMFLGCLCGKNVRTPSALSPILPGLPHHTRPALEGINFIAVMFSGIPERPEIWQLL